MKEEIVESAIKQREKEMTSIIIKEYKKLLEPTKDELNLSPSTFSSKPQIYSF